MRSAQQAAARVAHAFLVALAVASLAHASAPTRVGNVPINKPAPNFSVNSFNGQPLRLSHFRGKVVLLNFWATWCAPCMVEMPIFAAWQHTYGLQGFQVIGISMDDSPTSARRLVEHLKVDYPVAMGDLRLAERYGGVLGLPLTFLIDRRGIVRERFQGEIDPKTIERRLTDLLAQH